MSICFRSRINRIISVILLCVFVLSGVSCVNIDNKNNNQREISQDSPWYEGTIIDIDLGFDTKRTIDYLFPSFAGSDDKSIVIYSAGSYKVSDWSQIKSNYDYAIRRVIVVDRNTKHITKSVDLYSIIDHSDWPEAVIYSDGILTVKCESIDYSADKIINRDYFIDLETETITNTNEHELYKDRQYCNSYFVGSYRIETMYYFGRDKHSFPIRVCLPDGTTKDVNIVDSEKELYEVVFVSALDGFTALISVATNKGYSFCVLDLNTFCIYNANEKDYEWLDVSKLNHSYNGSDGNIYFTTQNGVLMIDMKNKNTRQIFDFNWCGINRQYLKHLNIVDCTDNSFLFCGQYSSSNMFTSKFVNKYAIIEIKKSDNNPHAGKQIIEFYTPDEDVDSTILDAVIRYNNNSERFFIKLSDRYIRNDYLNTNSINSMDDYEVAQLTANSYLSDDLAIDLMNGEGPDILLNTNSLGYLNNENYLIDLSPYLVEMDSNKYFTNIIDGAKTDGKLYQLPISFTIEGIQTDPEYSGETGKGFTTAEYKTFLYETLNGKDVIESGQAIYFVKLFNNMGDRFVKDGRVVFSNSDFKDLAEYVNDNVQQNSLSWDSIRDDNLEQGDFTTKGNRTAYYCNCPGISGYLVKRAQIKNGTAILGVPSSDGRGPMFGTDISVAISAHSTNTEACIEFVRTLLSDDVQNELVMSDKFVLNRDALSQGCRAAIEYFNTEEGSQNLYDYSAGTYVTSHIKYTGEDIDNIERIILSCSKMNTIDSAIDIILIEEMPAYFLGQKTLDEVILIAQDRAQKVLDERG